MKKITSFIILILITSFSFGQSQETLNLLSEISGKWELDENENVTYVRVIGAPGLSKEKIYNRALNFFIYSNGHGKYDILTQNYELGTIAGRGLLDYSNGFSGCWHIVRIDVKDGKIRVTITLTEYEFSETYLEAPTSYYTGRIKNYYPINFNSSQKTVFGERFYYSHKYALYTFYLIENAVEGSSKSRVNDNNKW